MSKKKEALPEPQEYLQQMEDDRRHLSIEEWLEFLEEMREELQIRIRMSQNDLKHTR